MNKHAKNLQTMLALLPVEVCHVYRDTIHDAVIEIERLDSELAKHHAPTVDGCKHEGAGCIFTSPPPGCWDCIHKP